MIKTIQIRYGRVGFDMVIDGQRSDGGSYIDGDMHDELVHSLYGTSADHPAYKIGENKFTGFRTDVALGANYPNFPSKIWITPLNEEELEFDVVETLYGIDGQPLPKVMIAGKKVTIDEVTLYLKAKRSKSPTGLSAHLVILDWYTGGPDYDTRPECIFLLCEAAAKTGKVKTLIYNEQEYVVVWDGPKDTQLKDLQAAFEAKMEGY